MKDDFTRRWITENSLTICSNYEHGVLTLRSLHYQLVAIGMTNTIRHYKRVVGAMIEARRAGLIDYDQFSDHDRSKVGFTRWTPTDVGKKIGEAEKQIEMWMTDYSKNRWENQESYVELWVEKKALQGVFEPVTSKFQVALCPCKGYPSLTFLNEAARRFAYAADLGKRPVMLYFGDMTRRVKIYPDQSVITYQKTSASKLKSTFGP